LHSESADYIGDEAQDLCHGPEPTNRCFASQERYTAARIVAHVRHCLRPLFEALGRRANDFCFCYKKFVNVHEATGKSSQPQKNNRASLFIHFARSSLGDTSMP
jgi:hypothetical protein